MVVRSRVNRNLAQGFAGSGITNSHYLGSDGNSGLTLDRSQVNGNIAAKAGGGGMSEPARLGRR